MMLKLPDGADFNLSEDAEAFLRMLTSISKESFLISGTIHSHSHSHLILDLHFMITSEGAKPSPTSSQYADPGSRIRWQWQWLWILPEIKKLFFYMEVGILKKA